MKELLNCPYCKKAHEYEIYETVNVTTNPELKQKVLNNTLFMLKCPSCQKEHRYIYPFFYKDAKKKFMIQYDRLSSIMKTYDGINKNDGYIKTSATTYSNLINKIIMLENNLDFRIGEIYLLLMEKELKKNLEKDPEYKDVKISESHFAYKDDEIIFVANVTTQDGKKSYYSKELSTELYNNICAKFINQLDGIFDYHFDFESAIKFVLTCKNYTYEEAKKHNCQLAVISFDENNQVFALVPDFNKDKFKANEVVVAEHNGALAKVLINHITDFNLFDCPVNITNIPLLLYKPIDISYETVDNSDKLNNLDIIEMLLKKQLNPNVIKESDVAVGIYSKIVPNKEINAFINSNDFDGYNEYLEENKDGLQFTTEFYKEKNKGLPFVVASLEKKDVAFKNCDIVKVVNLESLIDVVLNDINNNYGIRLNISSNQFFDIVSARLLKYKADTIMNNDSNMKFVLARLNDKEKEYIGSKRLNCINKVYFENKKPKEIAEELEFEEDKVKQLLKDGYEALEEIVKANYIY